MSSALLPATALISFTLALSTPALAVDDEPSTEGKVLFETYCSACHTLALPRAQRLNRANWEWVVDDMVNEMGCNLEEDDQKLIIDYLVANYGYKK